MPISVVVIVAISHPLLASVGVQGGPWGSRPVGGAPTTAATFTHADIPFLLPLFTTTGTVTYHLNIIFSLSKPLTPSPPALVCS